jgi:PAS domain S-box-containing protein
MKPHSAPPSRSPKAIWLALACLGGLAVSATVVWLTRAWHVDAPLMIFGGALTLVLAVLLADQHLRRHGAEGRINDMQDDLAMLAMVARQTSNAVIITDAQRRITWVNAGFERITGYRAQEVIGINPGKLLQCDATDPGVILRMRAALDAGRPFLGEMINRNKSGDLYWVEMDIQPIRDARGELTGYMALESDITARREAESELRSSQSFLDKAGRIGGVGGWQLKLPNYELAWTDQTAHILEARTTTPPSLPDMLAFLTPEAAAILQPVLNQVTPAHSYWDLELPLVTGKGRQIWVRLVAECEYADGGVTGLVGAIQDVTVRCAMKAEIKRNVDLLRGAIDTIEEGFVLFDPQDRLVFCNERYRQMYDLSADLLVPGTTFEDIIREGARRGQYTAAIGREEEWVRARMAMHRHGDTTVVQHLHNGSVLRILERRMPDGHTVSFRVDITDLIQASEDAQAANRAKSEFIATISHELRTPLQSIMGFSELGMHFASEQPQFREMFTDIHQGGQRMLTLVNGLLDTSRFDGESHGLTPVDQDIRPLVDEVWKEMNTQASRKCQALTMNWPTKLPVWASVDGFRLQQVIRNVLANAIRFSPDDSEVHIEASADGDQGWAIEITDQGPGVPESELETIFQPFVQSSRTRDGSGGTGLGLHISRKIMHAMGGRIHAENHPQGGTTMVIWLPRSDAVTPNAHEGSAAPGATAAGQAQHLQQADAATLATTH